jgi:hypothetical protein
VIVDEAFVEDLEGVLHGVVEMENGVPGVVAMGRIGKEPSTRVLRASESSAGAGR